MKCGSLAAAISMLGYASYGEDEEIMTGVFVVFHEYEDNNGDDQTKFIGAYTTREKAEAAVDSLRMMPGFADCPSGFSIEFHTFDRTGWIEGFIHAASGDD
jgi:hypothetical protein